MSDASVPTLRKVRSTALFAPVIDEFEVTGAEALNADLIDLFLAWRGSEASVEQSNYDGWHSAYDLFDRSEAPVRNLCRYFVAASRSVLSRYWDKDDLEKRQLLFNGWVNVNNKHAFNTIHSHGGFHLSGVYFVKVPKPTKPRSGSLQFISPISMAMGPNQELWEKLHPGKHTVDPQPGRLLIFPGTLKHWVYPNAEDEERISVAFNVLMP